MSPAGLPERTLTVPSRGLISQPAISTPARFICRMTLATVGLRLRVRVGVGSAALELRLRHQLVKKERSVEKALLVPAVSTGSRWWSRFWGVGVLHHVICPVAWL